MICSTYIAPYHPQAVAFSASVLQHDTHMRAHACPHSLVLQQPHMKLCHLLPCARSHELQVVQQVSHLQEGRRKLLDLLIDWGMQRPAQLEQDVHVLQRTGQALDARFKVCNSQKIVFDIHIIDNITITTMIIIVITVTTTISSQE